jgi:hypothetical protein
MGAPRARRKSVHAQCSMGSAHCQCRLQGNGRREARGGDTKQLRSLHATQRSTGDQSQLRGRVGHSPRPPERRPPERRPQERRPPERRPPERRPPERRPPERRPPERRPPERRPPERRPPERRPPCVNRDGTRKAPAPGRRRIREAHSRGSCVLTSLLARGSNFPITYTS